MNLMTGRMRAVSVAATASGALVISSLLVATPSSAHEPSNGLALDAGSAAFTSSLGDIRAQSPLPTPVYLQSTQPLPSDDTLTASGERGMSLGGIGAGSFEINRAGTFGPWNFGNGAHEWRTMPQAAFHVREQVGSAAPNVKTLAVNGSGSVTNAAWNVTGYPTWEPAVLPAFPTVPAGSGTYSTLYPFGSIAYKDAANGGPLSTSVAVKFWSPIVKGDPSRSSLPVAYFDVTVSNPTRETDSVSTMFSFPNAEAHLAGTGPANWIAGGIEQPEIVGTGASIRTGLTSQAKSDPRTGVSGVTLGATDPSNTPDTQNSDWTIAAKPDRGQQTSYVTSWNANGDGSDIINAFESGKGTLPNSSLDASNSAGAVAVKVSLRPGETRTIHYILAWDFPQDVYTAGSGAAATTTVWMRRYTSYFGAREDAQNNYIPGTYAPHQGWNIANTELAQRERNLEAVQRWWSPIAENTKIPSAVRTASLNQIAYLVSGGSFWESGLVSNSTPPTDGKRLGADVPGTHLFAVDTGADGGDESAMSADVIPYDSQFFTEFMPQTEQSYLRAATEAVSRDGGLANMSEVLPGSPYVTYTKGGVSIQHNGDYYFRVWQYYKETGDTALLKYAYPAMVSLYNLDKTRYGLSDTNLLPLGNGTTHDLLPVNGSGVYGSTTWLMVLDVMNAATRKARQLGLAEATPALRDELAARFTATKASFESQLWDPTTGHYKFDTGSTSIYDKGVFADATFNQYQVQHVGLPDIMDPAHVLSHLKAVFETNAAPFTSNGHIAGAINLTDNNKDVFGGIVQTGNPFLAFFTQTSEAREIWPGVQYPLAALMLQDGRRYHDRTLTKYGTTLGQEVAYQSWVNQDNGYAFQVPESAGIVLNPPGSNDPLVGVDPTSATLNTQMHRNLSYGRGLATWDLLAAYVGGTGTSSH